MNKQAPRFLLPEGLVEYERLLDQARAENKAAFQTHHQLEREIERLKTQLTLESRPLEREYLQREIRRLITDRKKSAEKVSYLGVKEYERAAREFEKKIILRDGVCVQYTQPWSSFECGRKLFRYQGRVFLAMESKSGRLEFLTDSASQMNQQELEVALLYEAASR